MNEDIVQYLATNASVPLVLRGFVKDWPICEWSLDKWCSVFEGKNIPFRTMARANVSDEPCWERKCGQEIMTFKDFVECSPTSSKWMYFDYKYLHQWFNKDSELVQSLSWKKFGESDKGAADTTLWVGSAGAHTPAHQDTYGTNIVAQLYGEKRWVLFPPETEGLRPTRVPYEESSVYSELNFHCPLSLEPFKALRGGCAVSLAAGDALLLPRGWWHYVQTAAPLALAVNVWRAHEHDESARVSEALVKILVAQICKDLPQDTVRQLVNPNEDDIADTPMTVLFLQLETVVAARLRTRRRLRRTKRQRTRDDTPADAPPPQQNYDINALLENKLYAMETPAKLEGDDLVELLRGNLREFAAGGAEDGAGGGGEGASLRLTKALIDSFSEAGVIEQVKRSLLAKLS